MNYKIIYLNVKNLIHELVKFDHFRIHIAKRFLLVDKLNTGNFIVKPNRFMHLAQ